jgi:hypothetical protein
VDDEREAAGAAPPKEALQPPWWSAGRPSAVLLTIGEVVDEVPLHPVGAGEQDIDEVVDHDRDVDGVDRLEGHGQTALTTSWSRS